MAWCLTILMLAAAASCMEMRETVERMVMVRTTGSDLQPAATGYIYKKRSDGPASVVKMDETEILEQLSKFYDEPKVYAAPAKESDENKDASHSSEAYVIPVVEKQEEKEEHIDGIADDDYSKVYNDFDYKKKFADYLHGLGHFDDGVYHNNGDGKDYGVKDHHEYGDKGNKGYGTKHNYRNDGSGDYHSEKYGSFYVTGKGGHKKDYNEGEKYEEHAAAGHEKVADDHGHKEEHGKDEKQDGFHKVFDKNEFKKDHDFFDGEGYDGDYHKYGDGHKYYRAEGSGHEKGGNHDSEHHEAESGKEGKHEHDSGDSQEDAHSAEEGGSSGHYGHKDFASDSGAYDGKGYGYKIKH